MVKQAKNFNVSLATMTAKSPPAPQNGNSQLVRSELGTVIVDFEYVDVERRTNAGARATFGDGGSIRSAQPKDSHALSTLAARFVDVITLKKAPTGVQMSVSGILHPTSPMNPYQNISWSRVELGCGIKQAAAPKAIEFVANRTVELLEKCIVKIGAVVVPAEGAKTSWQATSSILGQRVNITRTGDRVGTDQKWSRSQLLNIVINVAENVAPKTKQIFSKFAAKYPDLVSLQTKKNIVNAPTNRGKEGGGAGGGGRASKVKKNGLKKKPSKK